MTCHRQSFSDRGTRVFYIIAVKEGNGLNIQSQRSGFDQYRLYKFESAVTGEFHDRWDAVNRNP